LVSNITGRTKIESVSENGILRKIFRLKRDEVTGGLRKLHDEKFHNLHCSSNRPYYNGDQIKEYGVDRACSTHG
jgi:hypothetical protein